MPKYAAQLIERAKKLRRNMTKQECHLWYCFLKNHKVKFYRQRPIGSYVADFYCRNLKLVIEIDGNQHTNKENIKYDRVRSEYLNSLGLRVLRFTNYEIEHNFEAVCAKINSVFIS
ncbi:MAG: endonuclease domain-containing protein [Synergistales bacterium]|nr:endonuclease domain-containing protein [Synergistales bacterium]MDY6401688.1 endonuclease domain-containing protein [Synergistales bacterium]MDY6404232.1 endonuclease domain-containing protein [Synergistales bacterium]MDY6411230.1 endonuclease domain-containing protein [Synergistales bacterium]MDY6415040.1 endonuclease domain-containing protein [Synergistales bacterium]